LLCNYAKCTGTADIVGHHEFRGVNRALERG
jgi:hypothetical protein